MLRNPPAEARAAAAPRLCVRSDVLFAQMARRMVEVPGYATPQLFTVCFSFAEPTARHLSAPRRRVVEAQSTEAFVEETLRAVCGSMLLAQYKKCATLARFA